MLHCHYTIAHRLLNHLNPQPVLPHAYHPSEPPSFLPILILVDVQCMLTQELELATMLLLQEPPLSWHIQTRFIERRRL
jgi:hypothetical protein